MADKRTALHDAAIDNDLALAKSLVERGAELDARDHAGWTPLHFAAKSFAVDVARLLIDRGAEVDAVDSNGNTPLAHAVFESRGRGEMIQLLLEAGADKNRPNAHGVSPMELAKTIANYDVTRWLV